MGQDVIFCVFKECTDEIFEGNGIGMPVDEVVNGCLPVKGQAENIDLTKCHFCFPSIHRIYRRPPPVIKTART